MSQSIKVFLITSFILSSLVFPGFFNNQPNQVLADQETLARNISSESLDLGLYGHGAINKAGLDFKITNSDYLNISLKSDKQIKVYLESIPKTINLLIESSGEQDEISANLTISNLEPNKTYYKYEDSYRNVVVFVSDKGGNYSWTQDLSKPRHVWFQEIKSNIFLSDNCSNYGSWDEATKTCVLNQDLFEGVEITANDITLDCNNHKITGVDASGDTGVYINNKSGVIVKNCDISNFYYGIALRYSDQNKALNNNISYGYNGITLDHADNNEIVGNNITLQNYQGVLVWLSTENIISDNNIFSNKIGIMDYCCRNNFLRNTLNLNTSAGIYLGGIPGGWTNRYLIEDNNLSNNNYGIYFANVLDSFISDNSINSNQIGIYFQGVYEIYIGNEYADWKSTGNTITGNTIFNNEKGAHLGDLTENNKIYHNNLTNNIIQAQNEGINNLFNNDYPSGGNYWSDYAGIDKKSGSNQDEFNSDGIGDTPYVFTDSQDNYPFMEEDGWELPIPPPTPQRWSFAIISDLHIGEGTDDYSSYGWNDNISSDQTSAQVEKLKETVKIINKNIDNDIYRYNLKFLVVTGDFTDSAELSELNKAKEILDGLKIPWIPIIGNHDVWPFYGENPHPQPLIEMAPEVDENNNGTDKYFYDIFNSQYEKLAELGIFQNWQKENMPVWNSETKPEHNSYFQNFSFDYQGYHFIGLDFNDRGIEQWPAKGAAADGTLYDFSDGTWDWFKNHLTEYISQHSDNQENIILLAHHPFRKHYYYYNIGFSRIELNTISGFLDDYKSNVRIEFAGHSHDTREYWYKDIAQVVETGATTTPIIRVVQVYPDNRIDYYKILPEKELYIKTLSSVDLIVTDPDGLIISKNSNNIPDAAYTEVDLDNNKDADDLISIPNKKSGNYQIQVVPESSANSNETYSIEVSSTEDSVGLVSYYLVKDALISQIPQKPYIFQSKERQIAKLSYNGDLSGNYSNEVDLRAVLSNKDNTPISNKEIIFTIADKSVSAITNRSGVASAKLKLSQTPGNDYLIDVNFNGDEDYLSANIFADFEILNKKPAINSVPELK